MEALFKRCIHGPLVCLATGHLCVAGNDIGGWLRDRTLCRIARTPRFNALHGLAGFICAVFHRAMHQLLSLYRASSVTIWAAAAPDKSLLFLLVGSLVLLSMILAYKAYSYWVFRGKVKLAAMSRS